MLDSLSGKISGLLGDLDPYCILHICSAMMVTLSDEELMSHPDPVIRRLHDVIEKVALRYKQLIDSKV